MAAAALKKVLILTVLVANVASELEDLCNVQGCSCSPSPFRDDLVDVSCQCSPGQVINLGPTDGSGHQVVPSSTVQLNLTGCHQVEILPKTLNSIPTLQNVTVKDVHTVILQQRLYEARVGNGQFATLSNFELENVQDLQVKRHTFEGVRIQGTFMLKSVVVERTPSLAFGFDSIREFSIFRSRFDRVSMWGFKLDDCREFNVLGESRFFSLASQAFHMKCDKFMLAYNTFDNLQDASMGVTFGLADIQGNTFEKLTGKPFVDLRPLIEIDPSSQVQAGFIFRENKFANEPTLPFNALAMPSFDKMNSPGSYLVIENNHFVCECDRMSWLLGAMIHNFDRDIIANGRGSLEFLQKLYDTAGQCLNCGLRKCETTDQAFHKFAKTALSVHKGQLKCSSSGQALKSQKPGRESLDFSANPGNDGTGSGGKTSITPGPTVEMMNSASDKPQYAKISFFIVAFLLVKLEF